MSESLSTGPVICREKSAIYGRVICHDKPFLTVWHVLISICKKQGQGQGQGHLPFIKQVIKIINDNSSWKESLKMKGSEIFSEFFVIMYVPADKFLVSAMSDTTPSSSLCQVS